MHGSALPTPRGSGKKSKAGSSSCKVSHSLLKSLPVHSLSLSSLSLAKCASCPLSEHNQLLGLVLLVTLLSSRRLQMLSLWLLLHRARRQQVVCRAVLAAWWQQWQEEEEEVPRLLRPPALVSPLPCSSMTPVGSSQQWAVKWRHMLLG